MGLPGESLGDIPEVGPARRHHQAGEVLRIVGIPPVNVILLPSHVIRRIMRLGVGSVHLTTVVHANVHRIRIDVASRTRDGILRPTRIVVGDQFARGRSNDHIDAAQIGTARGGLAGHDGPEVGDPVELLIGAQRVDARTGNGIVGDILVGGGKLRPGHVVLHHGVRLIQAGEVVLPHDLGQSGVAQEV